MELRVYVPGVDEFDGDGYPVAWQTIKHEVRAAAGDRCVRCHHPFKVGAGVGRWSPCDKQCTHAGPCRGNLWPGIAEGFEDRWIWPHEHSGWFRPYVAGFYAWRYLGQEISRDEAERRLEELLALEIRQLGLEVA